MQEKEIQAAIDDFCKPIEHEPQTEEEFINQMIFWGRMQISGAAGGVCRHPEIGIVEVGEDIDEKLIKANRDRGILLICGGLAIKACLKFNLSLPGKPAKNGATRFEDWFNTVAERCGKTERYEAMVFEP